MAIPICHTFFILITLKSIPKLGIVFLLSIIMLIPAAGLPFSEAQTGESKDFSYKFDEGFEEKMQEMSASLLFSSPPSGSSEFAFFGAAPQIQHYSVILVTDDKEDLINDLKDDYSAANIFNPENLGNVITADVPISMIAKLSENHNVVKIGDGKMEPDDHVSYDPDNAFHTSIRQAKEYHGITSLIAETGSGITVGLIDGSNSFSHNDLTSSDIIEEINCHNNPCNPTFEPADYGMFSHSNRVAGVVTSTGSSNSDMVGVAPDSKIILATAGSSEGRVRAYDYLVQKDVDLILITSGSRTFGSADNSCGLKYSEQGISLL